MMGQHWGVPPFCTDDSRNGRAEHRELTVTEVSREQIDFAYASQVLALRCVTTENKTGKTSDDTHWFATNL